MSKPGEQGQPIRMKRSRWLLLAGIVLLLGFYWWMHSGAEGQDEVTFAARRGELDITVLEGGSIQAAESQEIKCEVKVGYQGTKILKLVDEGYQITEEDIKTNKVLVELDSSELQKQMAEQEISFQSAAASFTDAQQNYQIQMAQNQSDILGAEQKARFALMDFSKFLGDKSANEVLGRYDFDFTGALKAARKAVVVVPSPELTNEKGILDNAPKAGNSAGTISDMLMRTEIVDFSPYAKIEVLGEGETKQKLRKLEDDYQVAMKEMNQAKTTLDGTKRLLDKGFAARNDFQRDEIAYENARLKVQTAETARTLYLKYEFQKSAEEALSKVFETFRELDRVQKAAVSKMAQAEAKMKSAQGQYNVQVRRRQDLVDQLNKCAIQATKPGLVVYGRAGNEMVYYGGEEQIREGATVRERQVIFTIPDLKKMLIKVRIHESYIKKIKKGQRVSIVVDAFPDKHLEGEVTQVAVLPDSQNRWLNPDLKVYLTTIEIDGTHEWLKPGMSAKAEIMVNRLKNVVYVPVQAIVPEDGKQYCHVVSGMKSEKREVESGEFNDEFIEIKKGVSEGDLVVLRPPSGSTDKNGQEKQRPGENDKKVEPEKSVSGAASKHAI